MNKKLLLPMLILSTCRVCEGQETTFKLCEGKSVFKPPPPPLALKVTRDGCKLCKELENCTTYEGSIQIQNVRQHVSEEVLRQFHFPKLTEITGYLLVSLVYGTRSLKDIFPNLAVIRGREVFLDYSLVVYENDGLEELNLPGLTTILNGGVRIEKNINLCYVNTVRWKSIIKTDADAPVLSSNNNDCYDVCYQPPAGSGANKKCDLPAGHGSSAQQYCWGPGNDTNPECQVLCDLKCGDVGCLTSTKCCHKQCLGGCSVANSPKHCHACQHFRIPSSGECVERCPSDMLEIDGFKCNKSCPPNYYELDEKCVKACPAGYNASAERPVCVKCQLEKCPKVCKTTSRVTIEQDDKPPIDSIESLLLYKECTEIDGNLRINIRGSGGSGIGKRLEETLGKIEKVKGYIVVRESASLVSLNFFKNLKEIQPGKKFDLRTLKYVPDLYNDRYALAILDNPKLEALWPLKQNLTITVGGIMVHLNPYLCPSKIRPLEDYIRHWSNNDSSRHIDISDSTNGNSAACDLLKMNASLKEVKKAPRRRKCDAVCIKVEWNEVVIQDDYRNVAFYIVSYREVPNTKITEYDGTDACSSNSQVWTRLDVTVGSPQVVNVSQSRPKERKLVKYVGKLKPFTLYAFQVEAVVLNNQGAKSNLVFIQTKEKVPSVPVGLEATDINSSALLVTWQPPLFPNGNITKYILTYNLSSHSPWKRDLKWCNREVFSNRHAADKTIDDGNADKNPNGSCPNVTCDCEKDKKEELVPEKQAALFAKEFQDKLYKAIFTKTEDSENETPPTVKHTTPTTEPNRTNCTYHAQNSSCNVPTTSTIKTTVASSQKSSKSPSTGTAKATVAPTKPSSPTTLILNGTVLRVVLGGLNYFSDYTITVCACTKAGCATETSCAVTKARTFKNDTADNLGGPLEVKTDNKTKMFSLSWKHPEKPNGVVLKYEIEITVDQDSNSTQLRCTEGEQHVYVENVKFLGSYAARVRTITPAGNGSWSNTVRFEWVKKHTKFPEEKDALPLGTVVGASLAASVVFVLVCGFVLWYIAHKRYTEKQIPGVLYASVNPEYRNATDVYIADEWEVPRDKIKLIRELGNGSFGMVYEGEADIIPDHPPQRVAVKTVSENASILDRVEFLQEASVMKAFDSNHVVRLMGVVSDGQPTLVIMELMENGDLKNFLRCRRPGEGSLPPPTLQELLQMAGEIADGMAYLAARKYVHRDLAARNCMVNHNFTVKIGDFGMTRDIYETDYYRKGGKGLLPVRWMAPESLKDGVFTSYSDVWSFGVVMWEMATLASQPYPGKSNEEVLKYVVDGGLMEKPEECPDRLQYCFGLLGLISAVLMLGWRFELMTLCWQFNPKSRPTFVYLISCLESDLSPSYRELSFYHTLPPGQLEGLLNSHCKHRNRTGTTQSNTNIESSA